MYTNYLTEKITTQTKVNNIFTMMMMMSEEQLRRASKVRLFFQETRYRPYWCKVSTCGCMGCVNRFPSTNKAWQSRFPEESKLTEEDIQIYNNE